MKHSFGPDLYIKGQAFCKCDALVIMTKPTFLTFDYMYNEQLIGSKRTVSNQILKEGIGGLPVNVSLILAMRINKIKKALYMHM